MFAEKTIWEIIQIGGFTIWLLIVLSVLSLAVIVERAKYFYKNSKAGRILFMENIKTELMKQDILTAMRICADTEAPFASVVKSGLRNSEATGEKVANALERQISIETKNLEKYTGILGTIGSTAVYIGLFGTVIGIIRAFHDISSLGGGGGGIDAVIRGIAEALICTAAGISIAVPAVVAYNYFAKKTDDFISDMELCASELIDILKK